MKEILVLLQYEIVLGVLSGTEKCNNTSHSDVHPGAQWIKHSSLVQSPRNMIRIIYTDAEISQIEVALTGWSSYS